MNRVSVAHAFDLCTESESRGADETNNCRHSPEEVHQSAWWPCQGTSKFLPHHQCLTFLRDLFRRYTAMWTVQFTVTSTLSLNWAAWARTVLFSSVEIGSLYSRTIGAWETLKDMQSIYFEQIQHLLLVWNWHDSLVKNRFLNVKQFKGKLVLKFIEFKHFQCLNWHKNVLNWKQFKKL